MIIKGAIFDLDGTLLDSMHVWQKIGSEYLKGRGIVPAENLDEEILTMSIVDAAMFMKKNYGLKDECEDIIKGVNSMIDNLYANEIKLKAGILNLLELLKAKGVKMSVATATDRYMVIAALKNNNIEEYFEEIFTCTEVGAGKEEPIIFEEALKCLGTQKEETYVFEDAIHAIRTCKNAGFKVVGINDIWSKNHQSEIMELADIYINSEEDFVNYFEK
ncbi:MAG: HAD family phosphatase [Anaerovoracaceae bacterium]